MIPGSLSIGTVVRLTRWVAKRLVVVLAIASLSGALHAADWSVSKGLTYGAVVSDNIALTENDTQSDLIALVTPSISFRRTGARASVDLFGALQYQYYLDEGDHDFSPRLQADANTELVSDTVFFDARATITQSVIDPFAPAGNDTLNRTGNSSTTLDYELSPYVVSRVGGFADFEARYTYSDLLWGDESDFDSTGHDADVQLSNGEEITRTPWFVRGRYQRYDYSEGGNRTDFRRLDAGIGYVFDRRWRLDGSIGREWNDFVSDDPDVDGVRWDLFARWTPNIRTLLQVGYGNRFWGSAPSFDFSYRHRRSVIRASYSRQLTNYSGLRREVQVFDVVDAFGQPITDPVTGEDLTLELDVGIPSASVYVDERFRLSYTLQGRRTNLRLNASHGKFLFQDSGRDSVLATAGISVSRFLGGGISGDTGLSWNREEDSNNPEGGNGNSKTWRFRMGLSRQLSPHTNARLGYSYANRVTNREGDNDYQENRVSLVLASSW